MRRSLSSLTLVFLLAVSLISCGGGGSSSTLRRNRVTPRGNNTDERRCHRPKSYLGVDAGTAFVGHSVPRQRTTERIHGSSRKFSPSCKR